MVTVVTQGWQLILLSALIGGALGGVAPSAKALMNKSAPTEQMGSVYGLDSSVTAAGRVAVPLIGTAIVELAGLRSVFGLVAGMFVLVTVLTAWRWPRRRP